MSKELSVYSLVNWLIQFKVLDAVVKLVQLSDKLGLDPFPGGAIVRTAFDHFSYAKLVHGGLSSVLLLADAAAVDSTEPN
jgi:aldehyde:ferredoxin oxidoreductase